MGATLGEGSGELTYLGEGRIDLPRGLLWGVDHLRRGREGARTGHFGRRGAGGQSTYQEGRVGFLGYYKARARAPVTSIGFFKNDTKSDLFLSANLMTDLPTE